MMNIRLIIAIAFFSFTCQLKLFAQSTLQLGTTWFYNVQEQLPYKANGFTEYSVIRDTSLGGKVAQIIIGKKTTYEGIKTDLLERFIYEDSNRIYFWNIDEYKLMYDFSLIEGDTLDVQIELEVCDSASPIIIDSVKTLDVNGTSLKKQYASTILYYSEMYGGNMEVVSYELIEKVGYIQDLIFQPTCSVTDQFTYTGLRCYTDSQITYKSDWWEANFPDIDCDSLINEQGTGVQKNEKKNEINVYPNPVINSITISSSEEIENVEVYDLLGRDMKLPIAGNKKKFLIDFHNVNKGFYLLKIDTDEKNNFYKLNKL